MSAEPLSAYVRRTRGREMPWDQIADAIERVERKPFWTPRTLADYLSISERTVRMMLAEGRIASYRVEGQRRIADQDVQAYLAARKTEQS